MSVALHDLKMPKHKVCENKEEYLRNWKKVGWGWEVWGHMVKENPESMRITTFSNFFVSFLFKIPNIESISSSEQLLMVIAYSSVPYTHETNGSVAS